MPLTDEETSRVRGLSAEWVDAVPEDRARDVQKDLVRQASADIGNGKMLHAFAMLECAIRLRRRIIHADTPNRIEGLPGK